MQVEAVRDDGAVLVTDGAAAAVVLPSGAYWYTSRASVLSKGIPWVQTKDQTVPAVAGDLAEGLARLNRELAANEGDL